MIHPICRIWHLCRKAGLHWNRQTQLNVFEHFKVCSEWTDRHSSVYMESVVSVYVEVICTSSRDNDTFLKLIFIGIELLYNIVLVSTVEHSDSAICIHVPPLFWIWMLVFSVFFPASLLQRGMLLAWPHHMTFVPLISWLTLHWFEIFKMRHWAVDQGWSRANTLSSLLCAAWVGSVGLPGSDAASL